MYPHRHYLLITVLGFICGSVALASCMLLPENPQPLSSTSSSPRVTVTKRPPAGPGTLEPTPEPEIIEPSISDLDGTLPTPLPSFTPWPTPIPTDDGILNTEEQAVVDRALNYLGEDAVHFRLWSFKISPTHGPKDTKYQLTFEQVYQGVPLLDGGTTIFMAEDGTIWGDKYILYNVTLTTTTPAITLEQAMQIAAAKVNIPGEYFLHPMLSRPARLVVFRAKATGDRAYISVLAWSVVLNFAECPAVIAPFQVNALDGSLLEGGTYWDSFAGAPPTLPPPCVLLPPLPIPTAAPYTPPPPTPTPDDYPKP